MNYSRMAVNGSFFFASESAGDNRDIFVQVARCNLNTVSSWYLSRLSAVSKCFPRAHAPLDMHSRNSMQQAWSSGWGDFEMEKSANAKHTLGPGFDLPLNFEWSHQHRDNGHPHPSTLAEQQIAERR